MTGRATDTTEISSALAESYRIEREIGHGGMATVFLAHDLKHGRQVAIKVIHQNLSAVLGADRFLREIEVTAALQHPHILPLFDSGSANGRLYYVMPFVEGESLRHRIDREKQLPIDDAVRIATDVASALDYAHRHAVVHRDIKPENVLLPEGGAVVADFGIALAVREAAGTRITQSGLTLGTPQYMSPEQAAADRAIDARSDVYSLGVLLYEMLIGEPPFTAPTSQMVVAKLMVDPPRSPASQRSSVPQELDEIVLRSLAKIPADRFATAGDLAAALRRVPAGGVLTTATRRAVASLSRQHRVARLAGGAALLVIGAIGGRAIARRSAPVASDNASRRFSIVLPDSSPMMFAKSGAQIQIFGQRGLCIAPDGQRIIYVAKRGATTQLYSRRIDDFAATPIPGTEGAFMPLMSPDGRSVAFVVNRELRKLTLETGQVVPLAQVENPAGATWKDDRILIANNAGTSIVSVPSAGGEARVLMSRTPLSFVAPDLLPDKRHIVYSRSRHLVIGDLETGAERVLSASGASSVSTVPSDAILGMAPRYLASGALAFVDREGSLMVAPFDLSSLRITGPPVPALSHIRRESEVGAQYDVANDGTLVYVDGGNAEDGVLVTSSGVGKLDTLPIAPADFEGFAFSPDGRRVAAKVVAPTGLFELWVYELANRRATRVQSVVDRLSVPVWTLDGRSLVAAAGVQPAAILLRIDALHGGIPDTLYRGNLIPSGFSPDGAMLAGHLSSSTAPARASVLRLDGHSAPEALAPGAAAGEYYPVFSPDGRWIAFQRQDRGVSQIVAVPYPARTPMITVSPDGGVEVQWSSDGKSLYYRAGRQWMRVAVTAGSDHPFGTPRLFAEGDFADFTGRSYGITPDGKRLLFKLGGESSTGTSIRVVTRWPGDLRTLRPPK